jgi:ferredoxin--NADP+ reductase
MHHILARQTLSPNVTRLDVHAPRIAQIRQAGQFVIVHLAENSERIPLTIADSNPGTGSITLIIQTVGKSTNELVALQPGDFIRDLAGPLGHPTEMIKTGHALCIGGGVGTAVVHPIAQGLHQRGVRVTSVIGARAKKWLFFEKELRQFGRVVVCTDDGGYGRKGFVTAAATEILAAEKVDIVYAVGPVPMMRAVADLTSGLGIRTIVSLNPVMIDGTGMCGGCRVSVGNEIKFACVDGPDFDGHKVDFGELQDRLSTYREFEEKSLACADGNCQFEKSIPAPA